MTTGTRHGTTWTHTAHTQTTGNNNTGNLYLPIGYSQFQAAIHQLAATNVAPLAKQCSAEPATAGARQPLPLRRPQQQQLRPQIERQRAEVVPGQNCYCCRQDLLYCGGHHAVWCCVPDDAVRLYNSRHLILFCISIFFVFLYFIFWVKLKNMLLYCLFPFFFCDIFFLFREI